MNIEIDALGADVVVQAEHLVEKLLPGDGTGPTVHQHLQQREFARREGKGFIAQQKKAFIIVLQLSQPLALLGSSFTAAQQRTQAGIKLLQLERLRQIVIRPGIQPFHPVCHVAAGGEKQHRQRLPALSQTMHHFQPVEAGHADIKDRDGIVFPL